MKTDYLITSLLIGLLLPIHAQTLTNGSFDDSNGLGTSPDPLTTGFASPSSPGQPTPPGWTYQRHPLSTHALGDSTPDWFDPSSSTLSPYMTASPDGGPFVNLVYSYTGSGRWVESFGQEVTNLVAGESYMVSFYGAGGLEFSPNSGAAGVVTIGNAYADGSVATYQTPTVVADAYVSDWNLYSFSFTATSSSHWLTLQTSDLGAGSIGSGISASFAYDAVSVAAIPEPSVVLSGMLAGMLLPFRRRR